MNIILLGAPGAGKGTQAERISEKWSIPQISTGNIIRDALKSGSDIGEKTKYYMDNGLLVPDEIVIEIIRVRLAQSDCAGGYILDGFPRTIAQAEALDAMGIEIDHVIDLEVEDEVIIKRLSGRRVCSECGATYHIVNKKPVVEGVCDKCGGTLVQRKDDTVETINERLKVYHAQTEPLIAYYEAKGLIRRIPDKGSVEANVKAVFEALGADV
ncbi:MAG: adenylate kinase [Oscillospiraceae bacterium]|jgi:adenylate kinase|nr:adenylate kinase [Oscillospiraceae bacterium]